jgi:TonB family protein
MLRTFAVCSLLLCAFAAKADLQSAMKAHASKDYAAAKQQLRALLPLRNEVAAYKLGLMAYNGEGEQQDIIQAAAYLALAKELHHQQADVLLQRMTRGFAEGQKAELENRLSALRDGLLVNEVKANPDLNRIPVDDVTMPKGGKIFRKEPSYPPQAAKNGISGYVKLTFLIDRNGQVLAPDVIDSNPAGLFDKSALKAIEQWRYPSQPGTRVASVQLDFRLDTCKNDAVRADIAKNQLLQQALTNEPRQQFRLSRALQQMAICTNAMLRQSHAFAEAQAYISPVYDRKLASLPHSTLGVKGIAQINISNRGVIKEVISSSSEHLADKIQGKRVDQNIRAGEYFLQSLDPDAVFLQPILYVPQTQYSRYWLLQAAKNGLRDAQWVLAQEDQSWLLYLVAKKDPQALTWHGARLYTAGKTSEGIALINAASAQGFGLANSIKQALLQ